MAFLQNNYPESPAKGVRQLNILTLEIKDSMMILNGPFTTNRTKKIRPAYREPLTCNEKTISGNRPMYHTCRSWGFPTISFL